LVETFATCWCVRQTIYLVIKDHDWTAYSGDRTCILRTEDFVNRCYKNKNFKNHSKKAQGTASTCCDLWTTKETYQKLLWYRFYNPFSSFCKSILNRVLSKFISFQIIMHTFDCFQYFFLSKLSTHFTGITWMDFVYGKIKTVYIFFTYVTKCINYAFFKTAQYVSSLPTPNIDWTLFEFFVVLYEKRIV
jgi:hypothetical protein